MNLQEDKSTALHFACAQGGLSIIQMMRQLQPEKFMTASKKTDILKMTPLHRAALFNHVNVVKFLIDEVSHVVRHGVMELENGSHFQTL